MSLITYRESMRIVSEGWPFYALIMAAMEQADTHNAELLRHTFPEVYSELKTRYDAPGGAINEQEYAWLLRVNEEQESGKRESNDD